MLKSEEACGFWFRTSLFNWIDVCNNLRTNTIEIPPVEKPLQFSSPQLLVQLIQATQFIRANEARSTFNVDGAGLTVAVLDTGIRDTHVDFGGRVVAKRNFTTDNGGAENDVTDLNGHGTNVSGIVAANSLHIGIAPGAKIVALKVLRNDGGGNFNSVADALQWVIDNHAAHGISVVNLGTPTNDTSDVALGADSVINKIMQLTALSIPVVIAAGNEFFKFKTEEMGYPAIAKESISVGAVYDGNVGSFSCVSGATANTTGAGRICPFSQRLNSSTNAGCRTDIFAPGALITSTGSESNNGESIDHGTSQASPVTVGTILLMQQFHKRATGKLPAVSDIETWLREGGVEITDGDDEEDNVTHNNKKYLRLDAFGAIQAIRTELTAQMLFQKQAAKALNTNPVDKANYRKNFMSDK